MSRFHFPQSIYCPAKGPEGFFHTADGLVAYDGPEGRRLVCSPIHASGLTTAGRLFVRNPEHPQARTVIARDADVPTILRKLAGIEIMAIQKHVADLVRWLRIVPPDHRSGWVLQSEIAA